MGRSFLMSQVAQPVHQWNLSQSSLLANMKLIYNKSGFSQKLYVKNLKWHTSTCNWFASTENMKILDAIKNIMEQEGLSEQEACVRFKVEVNLISCWNNYKEGLHYSKNSLKFSIHQGPCSIIEDVTQDIVDFVKEWCGRSLPVNCFNLIKNACQLKTEFAM